MPTIKINSATPAAIPAAIGILISAPLGDFLESTFLLSDEGGEFDGEVFAVRFGGGGGAKLPEKGGDLDDVEGGVGEGCEG